ncbi:hypothetical protein P5V15_005566 [Pogonomyrmex californicus]
MTDKRWNDDIAYSFFTHRIFLRIYGLWPLQTQTVFTNIRWNLFLIAQFMILPFLLVDSFWSDQNAGSNIENILYFTSTVTGIIKNVCVRINQKKLATNINAAIDDWLSAKDNKETQMIMKKYALKARMLTFTLLYSAVGCFSIYVLAIVFINLQQIYFMDENLVDANTTNWILFIPCGPLSKSINGLQFVIILVIQILQTISLCIILSIVDTFFFTMTIHLAGQLEVLRKKFTTFANEPDTEANYRKKFVSLINRHSKLTEFYQNLEDTFNFLILSQLVSTTIMIALVGMRINLCINEKNHIELTKSVLVLNYLFMQSLIFTYAGDFLQTKSEDIFHALYATSWFTLPLALMKDLHFAMMRSSVLLRLTGGKFFYVNRETMMYMLKTSASYVSVLRIALRN